MGWSSYDEDQEELMDDMGGMLGGGKNFSIGISKVDSLLAMWEVVGNYGKNMLCWCKLNVAGSR